MSQKRSIDSSKIQVRPTRSSPQTSQFRQDSWRGALQKGRSEAASCPVRRRRMSPDLIYASPVILCDHHKSGHLLSTIGLSCGISLVCMCMHALCMGHKQFTLQPLNHCVVPLIYISSWHICFINGSLYLLNTFSHFAHFQTQCFWQSC